MTVVVSDERILEKSAHKYLVLRLSYLNCPIYHRAWVTEASTPGPNAGSMTQVNVRCNERFKWMVSEL